MAAAKIFNSKMGSNDRVGLVSFGTLVDSNGPNGVAELRKGFEILMVMLIGLAET